MARASLAAVLAIAVAAIAVTLATPATAIPPGGPDNVSNGARVSIDRTSVTQGGRIRVSGSNWKSKGSRNSRKAEVTIKLDDLDILAVFPIKNKRFSGSVPIPRQVRTGRHWLRFLAARPATSIKSKFFTVKKR